MVNYEHLNKMCGWERKKALFLIQVAEGLGMDTEGYGEIAVNQNSGYTYLWLEDYNFTLYMPINCELDLKWVYALYTDSYDGEEIETIVGEKSLEELEGWAKELYEEARKKEEGVKE